MKIFLLLFTLIPVFSSFSEDTKRERASCPGMMPETACVDFWRYEYVFTATVLRAELKPYSTTDAVPYWQQHAGLTATLRIDELFRGSALGTEVTIEMGDCYYPFEAGRSYLVYANKHGGKLQQRRNMSRTLLLSDAAEDLKYIRSLPSAPPSRIFGKVYEAAAGGNLLIVQDSMQGSKPSHGVKVVAKSGSKTYETQTEQDGSYEFVGLPAASYDIRLDIPTHLDSRTHQVTVNAKGCYPASFYIEPTGSISGRLVDHVGKPVANSVVSIFLTTGVTEQLIEKVQGYQLRRSQTDGSGSFSFNRLPAGEYFLAVNLTEKEQVKTNEAVGYQRFFYPGVTRVTAASPILLDHGKALRNVEIVMPQESRKIQ